MRERPAGRAQYPMHIDGRQIQAARSTNIHSCGPRRSKTAIDLCLRHCSPQRKLTVYDPLCGNGVIPTVFRAHFSERMKMILASDASRVAVDTTTHNLRLFEGSEASPSEVFHHNILREFPGTIEDGSIDLLVTDPPYGSLCKWIGLDSGVIQHSRAVSESMREALFRNIGRIVAPDGVVAIITGCGMILEEEIGAFQRTAEHEIEGHSQMDHRKLYIMKRSSV